MVLNSGKEVVRFKKCIIYKLDVRRSVYKRIGLTLNLSKEQEYERLKTQHCLVCGLKHLYGMTRTAKFYEIVFECLIYGAIHLYTV